MFTLDGASFTALFRAAGPGRAEYRVPRLRRLAGVLASAPAWLTWLVAAVSLARRRDRLYER